MTGHRSSRVLYDGSSRRLILRRSNCDMSHLHVFALVHARNNTSIQWALDNRSLDSKSRGLGPDKCPPTSISTDPPSDPHESFGPSCPCRSRCECFYHSITLYFRARDISCYQLWPTRGKEPDVSFVVTLALSYVVPIIFIGSSTDWANFPPGGEPSMLLHEDLV